MTIPPSTGNPPLTRERWLDRLQFQHHRRETMLSRAPSVNDPRELAMIDCQRLSIAATVAEDYADAGAAACEIAAAGAAAVLATALSGGEVVMRWPDNANRRIPTSSPPLGPSDWTRCLACALMARDKAATEILCAPPHIAAAQAQPGLADEFWPFLCTALAALVRQPEAVEIWLKEAEPLMLPEKTTKGDPEAIKAHGASLIPLIKALASGAGWETALTSAIAVYHAHYEAHGQPGDPLRLLPIAITGLAALAFDRGIESQGLPRELVRGEFERTPVEVTFQYATRFAERAGDPMGFLDLEGFPPSQRKHVVGTRDDGQLVARYQLARAGVPKAAVEFVLPEDGGSHGDLPPAMDPGERLLLAELYAGRNDAASVADAVDQVDVVLAAIPSGDEAVPETAFLNPRGRRAYRNEPGRFRRDRLTAYRDSLRSHVAGPPENADGAPPDPAMTAELQTYVGTVQAAEVVKQALLPLLDVLRRDMTGRATMRLHPRPEDYSKVFEAEAVVRARTAYEAMWDKGLAVEASRRQTEVRIAIAPAGLLAGDNEFSRQFPGGYRSIAALLNPRRTWAAWRYVEPGASSGLAYDGLVWCDDHWSWFPKPYLILRQSA